MELQLVEHNRNGLRPEGHQKNAPFYQRLKNLRCLERGLRPLQEPNYSGVVSSPALSYSHPFPQFLPGRGSDLLLAGATTLHSVNVASLPDTATQYSTLYGGIRGADLVSNGHFTTDATGWTITGWAHNASEGWIAHNTGNTTQLVQAVGTLTTGHLYEVVFQMKNRTAGSVTPYAGTQAGSAVSSNGWVRQYITCASTTTLGFTPTSDFDGSLDNIRCKRIQTDTITSGGTWHMAPFRPGSWLITNGASFIYLLPSGISTVPNLMDSALGLTVNSVLNHENRLVMGGLAGTLTTGSDFAAFVSNWRRSAMGDNDVRRDIVLDENFVWGTNCILISERGGGAVDTPLNAILAMLGIPDATRTDELREYIDARIERNEIQIIPLEKSGANLCNASFGSSVICGNERSVCVLMPVNEAGMMREYEMLRHGIPGRGALGGGDGELIFVSKQGQLYMIGEGAQRYAWAKPVPTSQRIPLYRLGYDEFIGAMTLANIVISYDPEEQEYFINDGVTCYGLSRTGLFRADATKITSCLRLSEYTSGLVGTGGFESDPQTPEILTESFDGGVKGVKELTRTKLACDDTDTTGWTVTAYYREQIENSVGAGQATAVTVDERGIALNKQLGVEHAIHATAANRKLVGLDRIDIELNMVSDAKPSIRSIVTP